MQLLTIPVTSLEDATHNFEQMAPFSVGKGAPTYVPTNNQVTFHFRTDTPTVANQRIYIYTGSVWNGIV